MNSTELVVVANDTRLEEANQIWEGSLAGVAEWPDEPSEGSRLLEQLYAEGARRFAIFGDDELVGKVVTAYRRRPSLGEQPLDVWALDVGEARVAGQGRKQWEPSAAARRFARGVDRWERTKVGTIKVSASVEPAAWYGFSFGTGWVYRAFEARIRARGGVGNFATAFGRLATDTVSEDERPVARRVTVDYRPVDDGGSMVASTLADSYFGLGSDGDRAAVWKGIAASGLMRQAMTPGVLERGEAEAKTFEAIHLDSPDGWVLDGRLYGSDKPGVVQVVPGPTIDLVEPAGGIGSALRGWLG